jgi:ATP-dependent RNA helicase DeaD
MKTNAFKALGLDKTLNAILEKGFTVPTTVQAMTIPLLLSGTEDIVAQARTGTGKTAAFGLPLIEMLTPKAGHVQAIVLTPTRELALQVCTEISDYSKNHPFSLLPVYGGQSMSEQLKRLRSGVDIVVGTPGRVMDHLRRGSLKLADVKYVVLDEADEMLDMGFVDDIETILQSANKERRMLLFSATMSPRIMKIAEKYMRKFTVIKAPAGESAAQLTEQIAYEVEERDRFEALCRIISIEGGFYGIVFCKTRADVDNVAHKLSRRGFGAEALHGDVSQAQREKILSKMRSKENSILVATDVAARGIDISGLTHVINYALPQDPEAYIHRIGRTGRAGKNGTAITLVSRSEYRKLNFIKKITGTKITEKILPTVDHVIDAKRTRILERIANAINNGAPASCKEMALALVKGNDPVDTVAALLAVSFGEELDHTQYAEIKKADPRSEKYERSERSDRSYNSRSRSKPEFRRSYQSNDSRDSRPSYGKKSSSSKFQPKREKRAG